MLRLELLVLTCPACAKAPHNMTHLLMMASTSTWMGLLSVRRCTISKACCTILTCAHTARKSARCSLRLHSQHIQLELKCSPLGASCRCCGRAASRSMSTCRETLCQHSWGGLLTPADPQTAPPDQMYGSCFYSLHSPLHDWALCLAKPLLLVSASCVRDEDGRLLLHGDVVLQGDVVHLQTGVGLDGEQQRPLCSLALQDSS